MQARQRRDRQFGVVDGASGELVALGGGMEIVEQQSEVRTVLADIAVIAVRHRDFHKCRGFPVERDFADVAQRHATAYRVVLGRKLEHEGRG